MPRKIDKPSKPTPQKDPSYYQAVGRRKDATARVRLYLADSVHMKGCEIKKGEIYINGKRADQYFQGAFLEKRYILPLEVTQNLGRFAISAVVSGGGTLGQLGAVVHGISRAIEKVDKEKYRPILKKHGLLTRDPRTKERRKAGFAQKARARKQSPKR